MTEKRSNASTSSLEGDLQDLHLQSKLQTIRLADAGVAGAALLALLAGLSVMGAAGDALRVYDETHLPGEYWLPLWPDDVNSAPTSALVAAGAAVTLANLAGLAFHHVGSLRARASLHLALTFLAPLLGLVASLAAISVYYAADASDARDTLLSWTCRWRDVPMAQAPHWGPLCTQSRAALYLAVVLVPLEAAALALAGARVKVVKYTERYLAARKTPVLN
ncbi:hypothetical protein VTJ83DRAFT_976 [Remersonia thermophila]|uniref:Uncharacterized protein n=1 Tax=Remersonia thermophila TaxID=72144 RepID=A0ABR4DNB1_9PEZI